MWMRSAASEGAGTLASYRVIPITRGAKAKNTKKLIAWDIEASPDQNDGNKFKCYAVGMAWLNAEGKMKYKKAFGRDALSKLLEFLYGADGADDGGGESLGG